MGRMAGCGRGPPSKMTQTRYGRVGASGRAERAALLCGAHTEGGNAVSDTTARTPDRLLEAGWRSRPPQWVERLA